MAADGTPFVAVVAARPLPVQLAAPVKAAAQGDRIHLAGGWSSTQPAVHLALDGAGAELAGPTPLPLGGIASVAALPRGVVIGGSKLDGGGPAVLELDQDGAVRRMLPLPALGSLSAWPVVGVLGGVPWALWATGPAQPGLWCARLDDQVSAPVRVLEPSHPVVELAVTTVAGRLVAACLHGTPAALDLVFLDGGEARRVVRVEAAHGFSVTLASTTAGGILAWAGRADAAIHSLELDSNLEVGAPTTGAVADSARLRSVRLAAGGQGRLGVLFQAAVTRPGPRPDAGPPAAHSIPPQLRVWHHLAGTDALRTPRPESQELRPPGVVYEAAGWVGNRLLVVHGDSQPVVSAFEPG